MKDRMKKALRATGGFTLVELVVVLVILGILATMTVPALTGYIDNGKRKQAVTEAQNCVLTGNALAAAQRSADTDTDKAGFMSWAGGAFYPQGPAATGTLMLNEGSGAYYAEDATGAGTPAGAAADAIVAQAKVPGTINEIQFSAGGQVVYLQYTSGNTLVTYTSTGGSGAFVNAVQTPAVPDPVLTTPTPSPKPTPTATATATPDPTSKTIAIWAIDYSNNKLDGVGMKLTGDGVPSADREWTSSKTTPHYITLPFPTEASKRFEVSAADKGAYEHQDAKFHFTLDNAGNTVVFSDDYSKFGRVGIYTAGDGTVYPAVYLYCIPKESKVVSVTFQVKNPAHELLTGPTMQLMGSDGTTATLTSGTATNTAWLAPGTTYTLTNTASIFGYSKDSTTVTIKVGEDGTVTSSPNGYVDGATVTMQNSYKSESISFCIVKTDMTLLPDIPLALSAPTTTGATISSTSLNTAPYYTDGNKKGKLSAKFAIDPVKLGVANLPYKDRTTPNMESIFVSLPGVTIKSDTAGVLQFTPDSNTATTEYQWDAATGTLYLICDPIPERKKLELSWKSSTLHFPKDENGIATVAFVSSAATLPSTTSYKPDSYQYNAPVKSTDLTNLKNLFKVYTGEGTQTVSAYSFRSLTYKDDVPGEYLVNIASKDSGYCTLRVIVYDYDTVSFAMGAAGDESELTFLHVLPWDFYKVRGADAPGTITLRPGNVITEGSNLYVTTNALTQTVTADTDLSTLQSQNPGNLAAPSTSENIDLLSNFDAPGTSGHLGYINTSKTLKAMQSGAWGTTIPTWCYRVAPGPTVTLKIVDSLSFDYCQVEYTDFQNKGAQLYDYAPLQSGTYHLEKAASPGTMITGLSGPSGTVANSFTIKPDTPVELYLPAGEYILVQDSLDDSQTTNWYECSDNNDTKYPDAKGHNMTTTDGKTSLTFTVERFTVQTVSMVYRPYFTIKLGNAITPGDTTSLDLMFARYQYGQSTMKVDTFEDGSPQQFTRSLAVGSSVKTELLPRSNDNSLSIDTLREQGATNGFDRGLMYLTVNDAASDKQIRLQFNYGISVASPADHFFSQNFLFRVSYDPTTKKFTAQNVKYIKSPAAGDGDALGNIENLSVINGNSVAFTVYDQTISQKLLTQAATQLMTKSNGASIGNTVTRLDSSLIDNDGTTIYTIWNSLDSKNQLVLRSLTWCLWRQSGSDAWRLLATTGQDGETGKPMYAFRLNDSTLQYKDLGAVGNVTTANSKGQVNKNLTLTSAIQDAAKSDDGWANCTADTYIH